MSILIDGSTTFIVQGITGREAVNLTRECLDYGEGARIVGGVTPGRLGREVHGVPVFDTVAQAVDHHGGPVDGSVVTVPPAFTKDAVLEAIAELNQVAKDLGEDEDWLWDIANEMEIEDGVIWVYGVGEDGVQAFTDFGIENLIELIRFYKENPGLLRR